MIQTTATQVKPGQRVRLEGINPEPVPALTVEMTRDVTFDTGGTRMVEITLWPTFQPDDAFPKPRSEREHHFYAQFMVTVLVVPDFPITIVEG